MVIFHSYVSLPEGTSFLPFIQNFPTKTGAFFRPRVAEKESASEMLYCITSTVLGMEFQIHMSCKLSMERRTKIIKSHPKSIRSQVQTFRDPNPLQTESYHLSSLISAGTSNPKLQGNGRGHRAKERRIVGWKASAQCTKLSVQAVTKNHHITLSLMCIYIYI